jgi:hypothetical protein
MSKRLFVVFVTCLVGVCVSNETQAQTTYDKTWWHSMLNDSGRNSLILRNAQNYYDGQYGGQCKVWAQNVVYAASRKVVWLPQNDPYCDWRWLASANVVATYSDRWDGVPWWPGQIIQAQVRTANGGTSPHTMIVVAVNASSITVIESNWRGDERVRRRTASWADFKRPIVHYTIYQVK